MRGGNDAAHATANGKFSDNGCSCWIAGRNNVFENPIDGVFIEDAKVPVSMNISLKRF